MSREGPVRPTGLTRDAGWEIGVRRTVPVDPAALWDRLVSPDGLALWLGEGADLPDRPGERFRAADGTTGELRSRTDGRLLRLTWQPPGWPEPSTLQVRLLVARTGTTIAFHHERLDGPEWREAMREHWSAVIDRLVEGV